MARTDKRNVQVENKKRHKESLKKKQKNQLGSRDEPLLLREATNISIKKTFLVICEGKNTEPSYFNKFRLKSMHIKALGEGYNTKSLVRRALTIVETEVLKGNLFDEVWCVFDKDSFSNSDFNDAITMALENKMKVGYSNQSFEYWLLLHFNDHQGGKLGRKDCVKKLNEHLSVYTVKYESDKSKVINKDFFELMLSKEKNDDKKSRVEKAILRAESIDKNLSNKNPAMEESSTKLYLLIREILKDM